MSDQRGFTYTEQHRHDCEVRYVMKMPSRALRAEYLDSLVKWRGQAAVDCIKADLVALWEARRVVDQPPTPAIEVARSADAAVNPEVNTDPPGVGSFQHFRHEGPFRPDGCVVSGVAAW